MAQRWQMPFASSRGYSSLKLQHDVAEMLNHRYARTGQMAVVYFISDHDPSGFDRWEASANFNVRIADFIRIGLMREQVDDLDSARLREGIAVKPSDSRAERYIKQYGERCWETDILPASVIEQALGAHMRSWLGVKLRAQRDAEIERTAHCCRRCRTRCCPPRGRWCAVRTIPKGPPTSRLSPLG
jgi:hypothetical protein